MKYIIVTDSDENNQAGNWYLVRVLERSEAWAQASLYLVIVSDCNRPIVAMSGGIYNAKSNMYLLTAVWNIYAQLISKSNDCVISMFLSLVWWQRKFSMMLSYQKYIESYQFCDTCCVYYCEIAWGRSGKDINGSDDSNVNCISIKWKYLMEMMVLFLVCLAFVVFGVLGVTAFVTSRLYSVPWNYNIVLSSIYNGPLAELMPALGRYWLALL